MPLRPTLPSSLRSVSNIPRIRFKLKRWRLESSWSAGVIVLPTGAGKSYVGQMAIASVQRGTLVVAPTIDLMNQWYDLLCAAFGEQIGLIGGGYYEIQDITVTTYDSAYNHMDRLGNRWGLIIFDECHHLPGEMYSHAAEMCLAPYRLGLTATPERADGRHVLLNELIGPQVYVKGIKEVVRRLSGRLYDRTYYRPPHPRRGRRI